MNIRDIARRARVSVATVSRLLDSDKKYLVHPKTRHKIEKIIHKYHFVPNQTARALSRHVSNTIGMVTPFSTDVVKSPYFQRLIAGIIEGIRSHDYDLKWIMIRNQEAESCYLDDLLRKHSVDGIVFLSWRLLPNLVREIEKRVDIPAVLINDYDPKVRCSIVYCDNRSGIEQAFSFLTSKKYKKIGMIRGPENPSIDMKERYRSFRSCAGKNRISVSQSSIFEAPNFDHEAIFEAVNQWIKDRKLPQAMICCNDDIAYGLMKALKQNGIQIPKGMAVIGYDDSPRNEMLSPNLTSIRQPLEAMGQAAIETLFKLITKKVKLPIQLKFEPELIVRRSA